jgi:tRNA-2-methylthio-N6-dimethylallyladenosine synthase
MGRTECNRIVNFDAGADAPRLVGRMIDVTITEALPHSLRGATVPARPLSVDPARIPATTA